MIRKALTDLAAALDAYDAFFSSLPFDKQFDKEGWSKEQLDRQTQLAAACQGAMDALDFGVPDDPKEAFFYQIQMVRYYELALGAQPTLAAAQNCVDVIADTVQKILANYDGALVDKNRPALKFILERCKVVQDFKGAPSSKPPNWSDVVQAPFWEYPPVNRGIPWKIVIGVLAGAAVLGIILSRRSSPAPAPTQAQGAA